MLLSTICQSVIPASNMSWCFVQSASRLRVQTSVSRAMLVGPAFSTSTGHSKAKSVSGRTVPVPYRTLGGGLVMAGGGMYLFSDPVRSFSIHSPSESEVKGSSTLLRPASPAALRRQTVTLVFLTSEGTRKGLVENVKANFGASNSERSKWFSWIAYFQEAGYDCLQMNVALPVDTPEDSVTSKLSDELHEQIRLSNLQRQPVLFVHHGSNTSPKDTAEIVSKYIEPSDGSAGGGFLSSIFGGGAGMFGSKPALSGLIVVSDLNGATAHAKFAKHPRLNTLIVANGVDSSSEQKGKVQMFDSSAKSHEQTIKDIERWLISQGYEG